MQQQRDVDALRAALVHQIIDESLQPLLPLLVALTLGRQKASASRAELRRQPSEPQPGAREVVGAFIVLRRQPVERCLRGFDALGRGFDPGFQRGPPSLRIQRDIVASTLLGCLDGDREAAEMSLHCVAGLPSRDKVALCLHDGVDGHQ